MLRSNEGEFRFEVMLRTLLQGFTFEVRRGMFITALSSMSNRQRSNRFAASSRPVKCPGV